MNNKQKRILRGLGKLLVKYKAVLGIRDWDVTLKLASPKEMGTCLGSTFLRDKVKVADITMMDPLKYEVNEENPYYYDTEVTLVHELLHVVFWFMATKKPDRELAIYEQAIEMLARGIVELGRKKSNG